MRAVLIAGVLFAVFLVLLGYGAWRFWDPTLTREYDSYQAAAADNVFVGGWLPDFIPASATRMVVTNDYDANTSHGVFHYAPAHSDAFLAMLRPWRGVPRFDDLADWVAVMESRGYRAYEYSNVSHFWVFLVNAADGRVEYEMR